MNKGNLFIIAAAAGLALAAYALFSSSVFALGFDEGMESVSGFSAPESAAASRNDLNYPLRYDNTIYKEHNQIIPAEKQQAEERVAEVK